MLFAAIWYDSGLRGLYSRIFSHSEQLNTATVWFLFIAKDIICSSKYKWKDRNRNQKKNKFLERKKKNIGEKNKKIFPYDILELVHKMTQCFVSWSMTFICACVQMFQHRYEWTF